MSRRARRTAALLALLLGGCATWPPYHLGTDVHVRQWLDEERFSPALQALEHRVERGQPGAEAQLQRVRAAAAAYDRAQGDRIQKLIGAKRWEEAEAALAEAQARFPEGTQIRSVARQLAAARQARAERLEAELLLSRITWLKQSKPLWEELAAVDPSDLEAPWQVREAERALRASGERLGQLGLNALSRRDYQRAEQLLGAAVPLTQNEQFDRALAQIAQQQTEIRAAKQGRARQREERVRRETVQTLSTQITEALGRGDIAQAKAALGQLRGLEGGSAAAAPLEAELRTALAKEVEALNAEAEELYATGRAGAAQDTWRRARDTLAELKRIAPDSAELARLEEGLQETIIRRVQALVQEGDRLYAAGLGPAARQTWKEARVVLDELHTLYPKQAQVATLQRSLEETIAGRVQILIKQGDDLYADGQIAEARTLWQEALQLAPEDPDLGSRVERADRVLERLEELQDGPQAPGPTL